MKLRGKWNFSWKIKTPARQKRRRLMVLHRFPGQNRPGGRSVLSRQYINKKTAPLSSFILTRTATNSPYTLQTLPTRIKHSPNSLKAARIKNQESSAMAARIKNPKPSPNSSSMVQSETLSKLFSSLIVIELKFVLV